MTMGVLGAVAAVSRRSADHQVRVVGVSDGFVFSTALTRIFGDQYQNHQLHEPPFLDLLCVQPEQRETADIVTCSEVLEHVPNPASRAFSGLLELLVPGGVAVLSVPHGISNPHLEHFPPMTDARIDRTQPDRPAYVGRDETGTELTFTDIVFHGGQGETLEHRVFSSESFAEALTAAGFSQAYPLMRNHSGLGMSWEPWSRVWLAVK